MRVKKCIDLLFCIKIQFLTHFCGKLMSVHLGHMDVHLQCASEVWYWSGVYEAVLGMTSVARKE